MAAPRVEAAGSRLHRTSGSALHGRSAGRRDGSLKHATAGCQMTAGLGGREGKKVRGRWAARLYMY